MNNEKRYTCSKK